jgi:hypothetical protein
MIPLETNEMKNSARRTVQILALVALFDAVAFGQVPLVHLPFDEGDGLNTANLGTLGGIGTFEQQADLPEFSANVPSGPFAPSGNTSSIDFGTIDFPEDGGRAIDFPEDTAIPTVDISAFTLTGWLNILQDNIGCGGNRIITTWNGDFDDGGGFELVHESDGRLRFSVNEAPDFPGPGPNSSPDAVTIDADADPSNWVFFAVSYDAGDLADDFDGLVTFYLGSASTLASEDTVTDYDKGAIGLHSDQSEPILTIGNFNPNVGGPRYESGPRADTCASRVLRGLVDDLRMYEGVLTLDQIHAAQMPDTGTPGDFDNNGTLDLADIDQLTRESASGGNNLVYDLTGDGNVNGEDVSFWAIDLKQTWMGDADLNGEFNSSDLVTVLASGTYENETESAWSSGDFSGDGRTNSNDLVVALSDGGYELGPRAAVLAVPEPTCATLLAAAATTVIVFRRRRDSKGFIGSRPYV